MSLFVPSYNEYTPDMVLSVVSKFQCSQYITKFYMKDDKSGPKNQTSDKCSLIKAVWYAFQDNSIPTKSYHIQQYLCSIKVLFVSSIAQNIQNSGTNHVIHLLA